MNDVESIEISIQTAKQHIAKMEALLALTENKHFTEVIDKGYFQEEASRLVLLRADPSMQKPEDQASILRAIDAIGSFRQYLQTTIQLGRMMEKSLREDTLMRDEILSGEDSE